jgi:hypothetical protein
MVKKFAYQHLPFKGPPKFTQIRIFGLKKNNLAILDSTPQSFVLVVDAMTTVPRRS